jgi:hypothetical protein
MISLAAFACIQYTSSSTETAFKTSQAEEIQSLSMVAEL